MSILKKILYLSYTSLNNWSKCKRYFYFKEVVKIERKSLNINFLVGKVAQFGVHLIMAKDSEYLKKTMVYFKELKADTKGFTFTEKQTQEIEEVPYIIQGMLKAYAKKYEHFLKDVKHLKNEVKIKLELDNCTIISSIDNLFRVGSHIWMHELKTSKELTPQKVMRIKTDLQHALYYYVFHKMYGSKYKIHKVLYDIIRKPSIRLKKTESRQEYVARLADWYSGTEGQVEDKKFYAEPIDRPMLKEKDVMNSIQHIANEVLSCKTINDYWQDFDKCFDKYGMCEYYDICHREGSDEKSMKQITDMYYRSIKDTIEKRYNLVQIDRK